MEYWTADSNTNSDISKWKTALHFRLNDFYVCTN
jgi:hypothetical protein